jgi:hypothetical protein
MLNRIYGFIAASSRSIVPSSVPFFPSCIYWLSTAQAGDSVVDDVSAGCEVTIGARTIRSSQGTLLNRQSVEEGIFDANWPLGYHCTAHKCGLQRVARLITKKRLWPYQSVHWFIVGAKR